MNLGSQERVHWGRRWDGLQWVSRTFGSHGSRLSFAEKETERENNGREEEEEMEKWERRCDQTAGDIGRCCDNDEDDKEEKEMAPGSGDGWAEVKRKRRDWDMRATGWKGTGSELWVTGFKLSKNYKNLLNSLFIFCFKDALKTCFVWNREFHPFWLKTLISAEMDQNW